MGKLKKKKVAKKKKARSFGDWYSENGDTVRKNKRDKYKKDKEYRAKMKQASKEQYAKAKGLLPDGGRIITFGGQQHVAYKLSTCAELLGITISRLRWYINSGYLPVTTPDDSTLRMYTVDQLPLLEKFLEKTNHDTVSNVSEEMHEYLSTRWGKNNGSKKIINKKEKG